MARTYWVRCATSISEGDPLDAHLCKVAFQGNIESVYEECAYDENLILQAMEDGSSSWWHGPHPVLFRKDRDGIYRGLSVEPFCSGGTSGSTLECLFTEAYFSPTVGASAAGAAVTQAEALSWTVAAGLTPAWEAVQTFSPSRLWDPQLRSFPSGDELGWVREGWLTFRWSNVSGGTAPKFGGFRLYEVVDN